MKTESIVSSDVFDSSITLIDPTQNQDSLKSVKDETEEKQQDLVLIQSEIDFVPIRPKDLIDGENKMYRKTTKWDHMDIKEVDVDTIRKLAMKDKKFILKKLRSTLKSTDKDQSE